ncbi:ATP-binding protein [Stakelama pacifica]|uniref:histidine kinase n=1 Tax=Stakelama pacifica TaxID=517720 RepID=A0A4R6FXT4_9SPHN|nr:ATP-binding protein [Stakelama pacifica]TDN86607.1 signal transduction histidine kinase [Stakelama pacifica]GGO90145.1 hypothetical protein GCM10011329_01770 [Stakelama pacifica]
MVAYIAVLVLALGAIQLGASLSFYQAIDRQTAREDHARRIAELLVVSDRLHAIAPDRTSGAMTTRFLSASVTPAPAIPSGPASSESAAIAHTITAWEPSLGGRSLRVARQAGSGGSDDLVGSIRLADGNWLNFRSIGIGSMWPVAWRAIVMTLLMTASLLALGLVSLHFLNRPLRRLTRAADQIGHGREVAIPEFGPRDLRDLAHAMNHMQARIARLIKDQATSFEAISHDLRTPLARQKMAADLIDDEDVKLLMHANVDEMEALLASLQQFLRAQHMPADPGSIDLTEFIRDVIAPLAHHIDLRPDDSGAITTYPEPLAIALFALIENAMLYGERVTIHIERDEAQRPVIVIEDDGPGIPPEHYEAILDPFFRLDEARSRDTSGFGLGIPTAHRLMTRFDGGLAFGASSLGGLAVRLTIPTPPKP